MATEDEVRGLLRAVELAMLANDVEPDKACAVIRWLVYGPPRPVDPDAQVDLMPLPDHVIHLTPAEFLDYVERTHVGSKP